MARKRKKPTVVVGQYDSHGKWRPIRGYRDPDRWSTIYRPTVCRACGRVNSIMFTCHHCGRCLHGSAGGCDRCRCPSPLL